MQKDFFFKCKFIIKLNGYFSLLKEYYIKYVLKLLKAILMNQCSYNFFFYCDKD